MAGRFAITDVSVVSGDADGGVSPASTILVGGDGIIEQVGATADVAVPDGYRVIDGSGRFVVPGLINAHAHLFSDGRPVPSFLLNPSLEGPRRRFRAQPHRQPALQTAHQGQRHHATAFRCHDDPQCGRRRL